VFASQIRLRDFLLIVVFLKSFICFVREELSFFGFLRLLKPQFSNQKTASEEDGRRRRSSR
jgi:hypothetical protein